MVYVKAATDIKKGEELFIDYCPEIVDKQARNQYLSKYGFSEVDQEWLYNSILKFNNKNHQSIIIIPNLTTI